MAVVFSALLSITFVLWCNYSSVAYILSELACCSGAYTLKWAFWVIWWWHLMPQRDSFLNTELSTMFDGFCGKWQWNLTSGSKIKPPKNSQVFYRRENNSTFSSSNHHHKYSIYMIHAHTVWKITSLIRSWEPAKICHQLHTAVCYCMVCRDRGRQRERGGGGQIYRSASASHGVILHRRQHRQQHTCLPFGSEWQITLP